MLFRSLGRGTMLFYKREYDAALKDFTTALELDGRCAEAYKNRGYVYFALGKTSEAEIDLERALNLAPRFQAEIESNLKIMRSWKR